MSARRPGAIDPRSCRIPKYSDLAPLMQFKKPEFSKAARLKRASKQTPLLLSSHSGKGVTEAKRALLAIIDEGGGTTAARRRAEAPAWQP